MLSVRARLLIGALRLMAKPRMGRGSLLQQRNDMDSGARILKPPKGTEIEAVSAGGVEGEWLTPPGVDPARVVFWLHGGGYYLGSPLAERAIASRVGQACGARALVIDYRLCPEHPLTASLEDSLTAYRWLLGSGTRANDIVVAGESAGGGLALRTLVALCQSGELLPAAGIALSPITDIAATGDSMNTNVSGDPIFSAVALRRGMELISSGIDPRDPSVSPLYADLRGLPPLLLHAGAAEVFLDDATRFADRARAVGVDVTIKVWDGLFHVFQLWSFMPEAKQALREIGEFARSQFDRLQADSKVG